MASSLKEQLPDAKHIDGVNKNTETYFNEVKKGILSKDGPPDTIVHLPPKGSPADMDIEPWTEFYLSDEWVDKATSDGFHSQNNILCVRTYFRI